MATSGLVFWILVGLMTVVAVLVSALPWVRPRALLSGNRENLNVAVYRDRLAELETGMDYPSLTFEQREQERRELTQELLEDVGDFAKSSVSVSQPPVEFPPKGSTNVKSGRWALFAIATGLPVTALLLYALLGTGIHGFSHMKDVVVDEKMVSVEQMVVKLVERLAANPDDLRGWTMLGRSYVALERYPEAAEAYARAMALATDKDVGLSADYAEVLLLANDNQMSDQVQALITRILQEAPNHPKGLWLAGIGAFQEERYQAAAEFWQRLKPLLPEESGLLDRISGAIAEAKKRASTAMPAVIPDALPSNTSPQIPTQSVVP